MTRKDYILIAAALNRAMIRAEARGRAVKTATDGVWYAADWLAEMLSRDNPRFDRERFLKACGVQSCLDRSEQQE